MNSKYKVSKYHSGRFENIVDLVSIEEPLEISINLKKKTIGLQEFYPLLCELLVMMKIWCEVFFSMNN